MNKEGRETQGGEKENQRGRKRRETEAEEEKEKEQRRERFGRHRERENGVSLTVLVPAVTSCFSLGHVAHRISPLSKFS